MNFNNQHEPAYGQAGAQQLVWHKTGRQDEASAFVLLLLFCDRPDSINLANAIKMNSGYKFSSSSKLGEFKMPVLRHTLNLVHNL